MDLAQDSSFTVSRSRHRHRAFMKLLMMSLTGKNIKPKPSHFVCLVQKHESQRIHRLFRVKQTDCPLPHYTPTLINSNLLGLNHKYKMKYWCTVNTSCSWITVKPGECGMKIISWQNEARREWNDLHIPINNYMQKKAASHHLSLYRRWSLFASTHLPSSLCVRVYLSAWLVFYFPFGKVGDTATPSCASSKLANSSHHLRAARGFHFRRRIGEQGLPVL